MLSGGEQGVTVEELYNFIYYKSSIARFLSLHGQKHLFPLIWHTIKLHRSHLNRLLIAFVAHVAGFERGLHLAIIHARLAVYIKLLTVGTAANTFDLIQVIWHDETELGALMLANGARMARFDALNLATKELETA